MPSPGFFPYDSAYDPYGHNRAAPSYGLFYGALPGSSRAMGSHRPGDSLFPAACWDAKLAEAVQMLRAAANLKPPRPLSIPIHIQGLDAEPETELADKTTEASAEKQKRAPSAEEAAVRVQAAARGFLARRSVRAVRRVEREAGAVGRIVREKAAALRGNGRARVAAGEVLMKMLLRLDAVRGAREYRRRVTRRVLALQDAVDALDPMAAPPLDPEPLVVAQETTVAEAAEKSAVAPELQPDAAENCGEVGSKTAADARTKIGADGLRAAAGETEAEVNEEREPAPGDAVVDVQEQEDSDAEGDWEMVAEEPAAASAEAPSRQEPSGQEITTAADASDPGAVDTAKLAEMVAALCERNAQQSAVISALTQRVDALERAVRQMEEAAEQ